MAFAVIAAAVIGGILYRLRGGWFSNLMRELHASTGSKYALWFSQQRTNIMRAIWSIPTAALLFLLLQPAASWWLFPALAITLWASLALYGHGAHMIFDSKQFIAFSKNKTELLTEWWLPNVFGGIPDKTWPDQKTALYNLAGMSFIGLVRNATAVLPLVFVGHELQAIIYALTGLLHGPIYWSGYRINGQGETSEVLVGGITWITIVLLFG